MGRRGRRDMTKNIEITEQQISNLRDEAGQAGDLAQVALCDRALDGDDAAIAECARAISEAQAQAQD